jgi:RNA polymerase sigma-70 factor (ECF subfamily)
VTLLDPEVVLRSDPAAVLMGSAAEVIGAHQVAQTFAGRARAARSADLDGVPGAIWMVGGQPKVAFDFTVRDGRIVSIDLLADSEVLEGMDIATVEN